MPRKGTYYLGRVVKTGALETKHIISALKSPNSISRYNSAWTFVDVEEFSHHNDVFFFGRLVKYDPAAQVPIVDPEKRRQVMQSEPNMTRASSPFVYIPAFQGLSFLHISNQIEYMAFMSRWAEIINASHHEILSHCDVDPIADLRSFVNKLKALDGIYRVSATVSPPNPMFGPLWADLKDYLVQRKTDRMKIDEDSDQLNPITTNLAEHVEGILDQTEEKPYRPNALPIGDAAILMAADGYGKGFVRGKQGEDFTVIRTSETVRNFSFSRDPEPHDLYQKTVEILIKIREERHMEH
jgi:hypothetical protein